MSTKRVPIDRVGRHRITPAAVVAFAAGDWIGLHRALGLRPWEPSPLDAETLSPPVGCGSTDAWAVGWPLARQLRAELEAVIEEV